MKEQNVSISSDNIALFDNYVSVPTIQKNYINIEKYYKEIKKKRKVKIFIFCVKELVLFIIIIISIIKYKYSLKVSHQEEKDFDMDPAFFMDLIYNCFFSACYVILALFLIQFKICSIYQLFFIIITYLIFFITNRGQNIDGHGTYNAILFMLCIAIGQIIFLILFCLKIIYKKKKSIVISLVLIVVVTSIILYKTKIEDKVKCKNWEYGFNNTKIDNDKSLYPCTMIIPDHNCYLNFLGPFFDLSKGISCKKRKETDKYKLKSFSTSKYINKKTKKIGFPITTHNKKYNLNIQQSCQNLYKQILGNLVDMDNKELLKNLGAKEKPEVILDYSKNEYGEIDININYDEELAKERKKLEKNTSPLYENVIIIFFDGISRSHFFRNFKKTSSFLEQFFKYEGANNQKDLNQKYHGFQFFKQHSLKDFTLGNGVPMFYGQPYYSLKADSITGEFKNNGYITCNINGICSKEVFYFDWQLKDGMERNFVEFDHEMFALNCDPNIFDVENIHSIGIGESSIFRRCLYGKESIEYLFDYGNKFWSAYKNNRKYLKLSIPNGHELSGQVSKYIDQPLYEFLSNMYENNLLKNTAIILCADHGLSILALYKLFNSFDRDIEVNNPLLFFILADKQGKSYEEQYHNINVNQQTFLTAYDIYHSLMHIIKGKDVSISKKNVEKNGVIFEPKKYFLGSSLFNPIDKSERFCSNYFDIYECICKFGNG